MTLLVRRFRVVSMQFLRVHVALPSYVRPVSPAPKVHILKISCPFSLVRKKKSIILYFLVSQYTLKIYRNRER